MLTSCQGRIVWTYVLMFVLLLSLFSPFGNTKSNANEVSANQLFNGDFEEVTEHGQPKGWSSFNVSEYESVDTVVYSGSYSVKLTSNGANGIRSNRIPVTPGDGYMASVYSYNESGASQLYLEYWNSSHERIGVKTALNTETESWENMSIALEAPDNTAYATVLLYQSASNVGVAYYDAASFSTIPPVNERFQDMHEIDRSQGVNTSVYEDTLTVDTDAPGQFIDFEIPVAVSGLYSLTLESGTSIEGGISNVFVDGEQVGLIDFYGDGESENLLQFTHPLHSGAHSLRFEVAGQHDLSEGYRMDLRSVRLVHEEMLNVLESVTAQLHSGKKYLFMEDTDKIVVNGSMTNNSQADLSTAEIRYTTENPSVIQVDEIGNVTAVGYGFSEVRVEVNHAGVVRTTNLPLRVIRPLVDNDTIIRNGGFEQSENGIPDHWSKFQPVSTFETVTEPVRNGSQSIKLSRNGANGARSAPIEVVPGESYTATVYSYNESDAAHSGYYLEFWNAGGTRIGVKTAGNDSVGEWRKMDISMEAPDNTSYATVLLYQNSSNRGTSYYDDAAVTINPKIYELSELTEVDRSPGLETRLVDGALLVESTLTGQYIEYEVDVPRSGMYTVRLDGMSSPNGGMAEVFWDDETLGTIDFFHEGDRGSHYKERTTTRQLDAGIHRLKLEVIGQQEDSGGFELFPSTFVFQLDKVAEAYQNLNHQLDSAMEWLDETKSHIPQGEELEDKALRSQASQLGVRLDDLISRGGQDNLDLPTIQELVAQAETLNREIRRLYQVVEVRNARPNSSFGLGIADAMELVYPKEIVSPISIEPASLSLAKGEFESLQAIVMPYAETLHQVNAEVMGITGPDGEEVSAAELHVSVDPLGSVYVSGPGGFVLPALGQRPRGYSGWIPDPIRSDLTHVDVPASDIQPFWVELHASEQAKEGTYQVDVRFSAEGKEPEVLSIEVNVWPFTIPNQPELATSMTMNPEILEIVYGITDSEEFDEMYEKYIDFLEEFKIEQDMIYVQSPPTVEEILKRETEWGIPQFAAIYIDPRVGFDLSRPDTWQERIDYFIQTIGDAMAEYEEAGIADKAYIYGFDESTGQYMELAKEILQQIKEHFPDVPIMTTLLDRTLGEHSGLANLIDIWVPGVEAFNVDARIQAQNRGDQVYWYTHQAVRDPLPNWFNGYAPSDTRVLLGPLSHKMNVDGFLYYNITRWVGEGNKFPMEDGILSDWDPLTFPTSNGDGSLFYPGADGPLASQRIHNFRDGMEDYNLMNKLDSVMKQAENVPDELLSEAESLLQADTVAVNEREYTKDAQVYRQWRKDVANMIIQLNALIPQPNVDSLLQLVEKFEAEGAFSNEQSARLLNVHLTAVRVFEQKENAEKVVQHMESYLLLLDHQLEKEWITEKAYDELYAEAEALIATWQREA